jgi:hypothetical protein
MSILLPDLSLDVLLVYSYLCTRPKDLRTHLNSLNVINFLHVLRLLHYVCKALAGLRVHTHFTDQIAYVCLDQMQSHKYLDATK